MPDIHQTKNLPYYFSNNQPHHILYIWVFVQPEAKQNQWFSILPASAITPARFKIKIKAAAQEGQANKELIAFLAEYLKRPKNQLQIEQGQTARFKKIAIYSRTDTEFATMQQKVIAVYTDLFEALNTANLLNSASQMHLF
jgi:uncharacterized protein (TIGR00251 family)